MVQFNFSYITQSMNTFSFTEKFVKSENFSSKEELLNMDTSKYTKRTINRHSIISENLREEKTVSVYLPPGYNELISYPIVYAQDGQDIFMFGRIATLANYLILEKNMEPIIIVGIDVDKKRRTSEYASEGENNKAYKKFITEELIPYIEERYQLRKETNVSRLLIGDSLGGTVSLELALENPSLFNNVLSLSGAFFQPTLNKIKIMDRLDWLTVWMIVGLQEDEVKTDRGVFNFVEWNRNAKQLLTEKGAKISYHEKEGEHIWGFWQKELPEALLYFFSS